MNTKKRKPLRIIAICFLVLFTALELCIVIYYIDSAINGFTATDFVGNAVGETAYGIEALKQDDWANLVYIPVINIASLIQCLYAGVTMKKTQRNKRVWQVASILLLIFNIFLWAYLF